MSDIFTPKNITMTKELGAVLKSFRSLNKVTAKSITEKFGNAASYISKLENGDIKKISSQALVDICCFISNDKYGIENFLGRLSNHFDDYSLETQISIYNIDELVVDHHIDSSFIAFVINYLKEHDISVHQLTEQIKSNEAINNRPYYKDMPVNIWSSCGGSSFSDAAIKLSIPQSYIENFIAGNLTTIHRTIALAIIYGMYCLGGEENQQVKAFEQLQFFHLQPKRVVSINAQNVDTLFGGMDAEAASDLKAFTEDLKIIGTITQQKGKKRIHQISTNMHNDSPFFFAYMSRDLSSLKRKSKETKQNFLHELDSLISKYSSIDESAESYD